MLDMCLTTESDKQRTWLTFRNSRDYFRILIVWSTMLTRFYNLNQLGCFSYISGINWQGQTLSQEF